MPPTNTLVEAVTLLYGPMGLDIDALRDMPFEQFIATFTPLHRAFDTLTIPLAANPSLVYQQSDQTAGLYLRLEAALSMVTEALNWFHYWTRQSLREYGRSDDRYNDYIIKRDCLERIAKDLERQYKAISRVVTILNVNQ